MKKNNKKNKTANRVSIELNITIIYIILISLGSLFISCDDYQGEPEDDSSQTPVEGSYFLKYEGTKDPSVFPQFQTYYFTNSENTRPIYIYGKNSSTDTDFMSQFTVEDVYGQEVALAFASDNDYFVKDFFYTIKLNIDGSYVDEGTGNIFGKYYIDIVEQTSFEAKKIEERELTINEYWYANDTRVGKIYDILKDEYGVQPKTSIENIFAEANIEVNFPSNDIFYVDGARNLTSNWRNELWDDAIDITNELSSNELNDKYIVLIGRNDYNDLTYGSINFGGVTITKKYVTDETFTLSASVCYLFQDKLEVSSDNEFNQKVTIRATTHELGHAIGKFLTPKEEATTYGDMQFLTDNELHDFGHRGNHFVHCVMAYFFIDHESRKISAENPHFCEGHLQMLLNTSFKN